MTWSGVVGLLAAGLSLSGVLATFDQSLAWGAAFTCALLGWGAVLRRGMAPGRPVDAGLLLGWGTALSLCVGGVLVAASVFSAGVGCAWVLLGNIAAVVLGLVPRRMRRRRHLPRGLRLVRVTTEMLLKSVVGVITFLTVISGFMRTFYSPWDDHNGYLPIITQLLQRGELDHPFSMRRMLSFGGQSYLQAVFLSRADIGQLHGLEMGISVVIAMALLLGHARWSAPRTRALLPLACLFLLSLPQTRPNTASLFTGVVMLLTMLRTMDWTARTWPRGGWRPAVMLSVVAAAAASLRVSYLPTAGLMVVVHQGLHVLHKRGRFKDLFSDVTIFSVGFLVLLLPWSLSLWQSNGTPLFPAFKGYLTSRTTNFELTRHGPALWDWFDTILRNTNSIEPWVRPLVFAGAVLLAIRSRRTGAVAALVGGVAGVISTMASYHQSDAGHMDRYVLPFVVLIMVAAMVLASDVTRGVWVWLSRVGTLLLVVGIGLQFDHAQKNTTHLKNAVEFIPRRQSVKPTVPDALYAALQSAVPVGEPIVVMVDRPWMLDAARNKIDFLDSIGHSAPPPGIPFDDGPDAMRAYFNRLGIHHLMALNPDAEKWRNGFYGSASWEPAKVAPYLQHDAQLQAQAARATYALAKSSVVLKEQDGVLVVRLEPAPAAKENGVTTEEGAAPAGHAP